MKSSSSDGTDDSDLVFSDDDGGIERPTTQDTNDDCEEECGFDEEMLNQIIQLDNSNESDDDESDCESDSSSTSSDESDLDELYLIIKKFPVQVAVIEKCSNTLDSLLEDDENPNLHNELKSSFQVLVTLLIYQNKYDFTHNDLHTNNIMFKETNEKFLYYKVFDKYYKVPTYGKIYKIIDFGRSIYSVNNKIVENDIFHQTAQHIHNIILEHLMMR